MPPSLEDRFLAFLRSRQDAESIDDLLRPTVSDRPRADFLLNRRTIIVEVKTLKSDPSYKIEVKSDELRDRPEFPVFYGEWDIAKVLRYFPDAQRIHADIVERITRSIDTAITKADDQIRSTKDIFDIKNAWGLLVLLNEEVEILSQELVGYRCQQVLQKKKDGTIRYPQCAWIAIVSEAHRLETDRLLPALSIEGPTGAKLPGSSAILNALHEQWSYYQGHRFIEDYYDGPSIPLHTRVLTKQDDRPLTRQRAWELQYQANPYLRGMIETDLFEHGTRIISSALKEGLAPYLEAFTHFLHEINHRGIDMRKLADYEKQRS